MSTFTLSTKAVNSVNLLNEVRQIELIFTDFDIVWSSDIQREAAIDTVDEIMQDIFGRGRITQWNVACDFRNNTLADMKSGLYKLDIRYRQTNCLNTTVLQYSIDSNLTEKEIEINF